MDAVSMINGALLVVIGVIAGAIADRIRGKRSEPRASTPRTKAAPSEQFPASFATPSLATPGTLARDVVRALVTAGYSKPEANAAMNAAPYSARSTLESWTRAALTCARKDNAS